MQNCMFSLKGKTAVVTGGYRGIGKCIAEHMAQAGANIVIFDLLDATETANAIRENYRVDARSFVCDVTNPEQVAECFDFAEKTLGTPSILFNNAGIGPHKSALDVTSEEWKKVIDVNLNGIFYMATEFARRVSAAKQSGSIINTASMSGLIVNIPQQQASYNASKAAVIHLTKTLAIEWAQLGIRVNCISPGYIATDLIKDVRADWQKEWTEKIPFGRMGKPEELAGAVIYLASDAASYTTGCNIVIDGGYTVV